MLKTVRSSKILAPKAFKADNNKFVEGVGGGRADKSFKNLLLFKKAKNES